MGAQWSCTVLWVLLWAYLVQSSPNQKDYSDLCQTNGCNCTNPGYWKIINCTFDNSQSIQITPGRIPSIAIELSIVGGYEITIYPQTFQLLKGFNQLKIHDAKNIVIKKHAFDNLNSTSFDLSIQGCKRLILENHAFKNMQTPIRAEISRCGYVAVQNSAFSRLQEAIFYDLERLELSEGAFTFENQGVFGRHGPVTNLSFHNVTIPTIPRATFTSALAEINIHSSEIHDIHSEAFKANQINAILINSSTIQRFHSGALSGQTLIYSFFVSKSTIHVIENHAIMAAISNFTVQFTTITEIRSGAINSTIANIIVSDNKIKSIYGSGLIFHFWTRIAMENNVIFHLGQNFLNVVFDDQVIDFSFSGNEIYNVEDGAFISVPELHNRLVSFKFNSNFFNQTCHCDIDNWLKNFINNSDPYFMYTSSFCLVDMVLSNCFEIAQGLINMKNFTELVCGPGTYIKCEPYNGETKTLDTTSIMLLDQDENTSKITLIMTTVSFLIVAVIGTIVIILVRSGKWLRNQGYCMRFQYNQNQINHEEEGGIVNEESSSEKFDIPNELTLEFLQSLRTKLEDPSTHSEAQEIIERLYELFIVGDENYTNNNQQNEDAHLYEELGNMQSGNFENKPPITDGATNFLKLMEDKLTLIDQDDDYRPQVNNDYSEPNDTVAVHLYSEPKNKSEDEKNGSIKSHVSTGSKMAFRPLPEKPKDEAGPSSQY